MTKSGRLEGEVCVSCDAVFDIPAHATFSENCSFTLSHSQSCRDIRGFHSQSDVGFQRGTGQHSTGDLCAWWITDRARRNAFQGREQPIDPPAEPKAFPDIASRWLQEQTIERMPREQVPPQRAKGSFSKK